MAGFNKVILIGNLTADPELKQTPSGSSVCKINIAVNRRQRNEDGTYPCDFFAVVAWNDKAEFVSRYFHKGYPILVCGQIQNRNWTDNQGVKHYATDIVADEVNFVSARNDADAAESSQNRAQSASTGKADKVPARTPTPPYTQSTADFTDVTDSDDNLPF